jgi:DNA-binding MarR family transcriptional regulator
MEASGLVRRHPDATDARSTFAVLTPRGRSLVHRARRAHHAFLHAKSGNVLDDRNVDDLVRIMGRIAGSIAAAQTSE